MGANRYVAFLRGINLGRRRPPMSQLKSLFEELGFTEVETFIASGNVVFSSADKDASRLETRIAGHLKKSLGYDVDTFIRTDQEVIKVGRSKIFPEDGRERITIHVAFLQQMLPTKIARELAGVRTDVDEFKIVGHEIYWLCRIRTSESKVWSLPEVKALRLPTMTMRNLTSVRKLIAKHLS